MRWVWRWMTLRHLVGEPARTLLTVLGVALGVAVFVSIRLANHSAMASFADTVDAVAGRANLQITGDSDGFDERLYPELRVTPGVEAAAPIVEAHVLARSGRPAPPPTEIAGARARGFDEVMLVLGLDLFSEGPFGRLPEVAREGERSVVAESGALSSLAFLEDPRAVAITRGYASRRTLALGDPLVVLTSGRVETLTVRAILESEELERAMGGNLLVTDIATAQERFGRLGRLDRIDLRVDPRHRDEIRAALTHRLPPGLEAATPQGRTRQVENMVSAFALNLTALSFVALFVAVFLIYDAVSNAVVRRRREIGILRGLGVTRREAALQFIAQGLTLGVIGGALGLALGTLLARVTLGAVSRTLTDLYLVAHARRLEPDLATYLAGLGVGIAAALVASLLPALEAARVPPEAALREGVWIPGQRLRLGRWSLAGVAVLALGGAAAWWTVAASRPWGGFLAAFLLLAGMALLAPAFTLGCVRAAAAPLARLAGVEGALGARGLREAIARTGITVASLMVAVGMLVALTIMVGSFRRTVDLWVTQTVRGDLYVEPAGRRLSRAGVAIPSDVVEAARQLPGVAAVDTYRGVKIRYGDRDAFVAGVDLQVQHDHGRLQFVRGDTRATLERALREGGAIVTESFAHHHPEVVRQGVVALDTPSGKTRLPVAGVFYDYSTDAGAVVMDRSTFERLWREPRTESMAIYLAPGADLDRVRADLAAAVPAGVLLTITPNQTLRARVLTVFDQTFQITWALQAIAVLVAVLGVVGTLTALILQRAREIGILRATGARRAQVRRMVLVESGLLGIIGSLAGCACGVALAALMVHIINRQFFGWTIRMTVDPAIFVQTTALMTAAALLSGLVPARLAASRLPAEAMRVD